MKSTVISTAIGSVLALGVMSLPAHAAGASGTEKCYGVAKAGKNDCAAAAHACAGQSKASGGGRDFIELPKGTCARLVGGSLTAK